MEQPDFFPIPSPCIGVCEANAKGYCKGCLRSREERLYWHQMTDSQNIKSCTFYPSGRPKSATANWKKPKRANIRFKTCSISKLPLPTAHHNKEKHEKTACLPACAIDRPCPGRLQTRLNFTRKQTRRTLTGSSLN